MEIIMPGSDKGFLPKTHVPLTWPTPSSNAIFPSPRSLICQPKISL
jgi:hypothetical protein